SSDLTHGDAELGCGEHERDVFDGVHRRLGPTHPLLDEGFELRPPHGHDRELRTDEERIGEEKHRGEQERRRYAHSLSSPRTRTCSIRRPDSRSTVRVTPGNSTFSPTVGKRPSSFRISPPMVS